MTPIEPFDPEESLRWALHEIDVLHSAAETLAAVLLRVAPGALDELGESEFDAGDDLVMSPTQVYRSQRLREIIEQVREETGVAAPTFPPELVAQGARALRARTAKAFPAFSLSELAYHIEFTVYDTAIEEAASRKAVEDLREEIRQAGG